MKILSHIPQQPDIPDEFIGCYDASTDSEFGKWLMVLESTRENTGWIFRSPDRRVGLSGWHKRKDELVNSAIKYDFTVLSFSSQAELDTWLKEGK